MNRDPKNDKNDRRGFLRSLFRAEDPALAAQRKTDEKRACMLAFKYAKNEEKLLKLRVEGAVHVADARYTVKVSGENESGETLILQLEVDGDAETVARVDAGNTAT